MRQYVVYHSNGKLWKAGRHVFGLCAAYNHATNPSLFLSDADHIRSFKIARAVKNRLSNEGYVFEVHYRELSNGSLWPIRDK